jgi:small multidrug resistance pump
MSKWLTLAGAIASEVTATLSLKAALTHPVWYLLVVAGYAGAFTLVSHAMRQGLALGVAYGIWAALGVASTAILGHVLFQEPLTGAMIAGLGMIIVGVLLIEMGSHVAQHRATPGQSLPSAAEEAV